MSGDTIIIVSVTLACTGVVGALGALAVRRVRRVSLVLALVAAALVPFVAVVLAVWVNVGAMFISTHDAGVARLVLGLSALPAVLIALLLGRAFVADVRLVGAQARALALEDGAPPGRPEPVTAELGRLVDELTETRERLSASRERERGLEASRRQIVAFVSHDLRAPLAGVRATVEGLQDGVLTDTTTAFAGMATAVSRMSRMLDDLSEISRADGQPPAREPRPVRLTELLEHSLAHAAPAAAAAGVRLEVELEEDLEVMGVPDDLARVLDNLLGNAVRSSGTDGVVRVAGRRVDGEARIAVADTCGGIPSTELPRVFDEGWQGSPHGGRGSDGLGLAIVDQVVAEHGGRVAVEPTDEGCRFEVALPWRAPSTTGA